MAGFEPADAQGDTPRRALYVFVPVAVLILGAAFWYVRGLLDTEPRPVKQVVAVQVFRPPPPPPPPEIEPEPPPPDMEQEEIDVPEPEPLPDLPDIPDMPPADQLGLDAEGVAGSDAFGLAANRGGRSLLSGAGRYRWYAQRTKDQVSNHLSDNAELRQADYKARILLWIRANGEIQRFRVSNLSGDAAVVRLLEEMMASLTRLLERPPAGLPQPISIRVEGNE